MRKDNTFTMDRLIELSNQFKPIPPLVFKISKHFQLKAGRAIDCGIQKVFNPHTLTYHDEHWIMCSPEFYRDFKAKFLHNVCDPFLAVRVEYMDRDEEDTKQNNGE